MGRYDGLFRARMPGTKEVVFQLQSGGEAQCNCQLFIDNSDAEATGVPSVFLQGSHLIGLEDDLIDVRRGDAIVIDDPDQPYFAGDPVSDGHGLLTVPIDR